MLDIVYHYDKFRVMHITSQTALVVQLIAAAIAFVLIALYVYLFVKGVHDANDRNRTALERALRGHSRGSPAEWDAPEMECSASCDPVVPSGADKR